MPSFSKMSLEKWRKDRLLQTAVPDDLVNSQPSMYRETIEQDIIEERARLRNAERQMAESVANLQRLGTKSLDLRNKYGV